MVNRYAAIHMQHHDHHTDSSDWLEYIRKLDNVTGHTLFTAGKGALIVGIKLVRLNMLKGWRYQFLYGGGGVNFDKPKGMGVSIVMPNLQKIQTLPLS